jgi:hypothetical protein
MVLPGFDAAIWLQNSLALTNGSDILLAERWADNVVEIHWLLRSRGRAAITVGVDFLRYLYQTERARIVLGMVPAHKRAARWFSRQVGGRSNGIVQTSLGPMELFS